MKLKALTLVEARTELVKGTFSAVEYVAELVLAEAGASDLNAFVARDLAQLARDAARADAAGDTRNPDRLLGGIPLGLKDNINTVALPSTGCTGALKGFTPRLNAPVAQHLFDAGALLAGKTNMHELAFGITNNNAVSGAARNPWNTTMIPGGSSGGSAAAVAGRLVPAALGTDTGGSVRLPAALCGVVGFRPSVGRYSQRGILPVSHTRDTAGPIARSVADIQLLDGVLRGHAEPFDAVDLRGLRIGLPRQYFFADLDAELASVVERALTILSAAGVQWVEAEVDALSELNAAVGFPVALYEVMQDIPAYLKDSGHDISMAALVAGIGSPDVAGLMASLLGEGAMPRAAYDEALRSRSVLQRNYASYFTQHRVDAMLFPTSLLPARPIGDDDTVALGALRVPTFATFIRNTDPGSNAGIPGISVPAGLTRSGLPVGLELDAPHGSDARLLSVAAAMERALDPMPAPTGQFC
jgi:indoleacetamide hydrolase